ncbi:MAG: hypothetical protein ACLFQK_05890 [Fibrobacterota bacterium]
MVTGIRNRQIAKLCIYDSRGRIVEFGSSRNLQKFPGEYRYTWDASGIPAGVYTAAVEMRLNGSLQKQRLIKKLVLIK